MWQGIDSKCQMLATVLSQKPWRLWQGCLLTMKTRRKGGRGVCLPVKFECKGCKRSLGCEELHFKAWLRAAAVGSAPCNPRPPRRSWSLSYSRALKCGHKCIVYHKYKHTYICIYIYNIIYIILPCRSARYAGHYGRQRQHFAVQLTLAAFGLEGRSTCVDG